MVPKDKLLNHITGARNWLDKAKDAVSENQVLKALSLLFLAQAEIKIPLKESASSFHSSGAQKPSRSWIPAAVAASVFGLAALGAYAYIASQGVWKKPAEMASTVPSPKVLLDIKGQISKEIQPAVASQAGNAGSANTVQPQKSVTRKYKSVTRKKISKVKNGSKSAEPTVSPKPKEVSQKSDVLPSDTEMLDLVRIGENALKGQ